MASTAALGGRDCGGNKSGNTQSNDISGGKGGAPGGSLVVPSGTASTGRGSGGGMLVDGRGGSGGSRNGSGGSTMPASGKEWESDMDACCRKICTILKEDCKVNFLALDFDLTIVDIHTSGRWPGTPEQLVQRIRPFFQSLIPAAAAQGMYLGVVTFSPQVSMISRVLKAAFPDVAGQIPIRGDDFSWDYEGRGARDGKQTHMASAVEELTQTHAASITRASSILIDDDVNNVKTALSEGVKSVWCNPNDPSSMIAELLNLGNPREPSGNQGNGSSVGFGGDFGDGGNQYR